jgi:glycosyltransferase involved in cell wall biosynthesis
VEGYADKILLLLSDDDLRKRLGANGRRFAESRLDKKKILLQLEAVYNELLN